MLHSEELGGIPLVQDVAEMEGAGWGTIRTSPGGLVNYVRVHHNGFNSRNGRGFMLTVGCDAEPNTCFWRWNSCELHGFKLGPQRRMPELRASPWELDVLDFVDRKMFAVSLTNGRVAMVDGVACRQLDPNKQPGDDGFVGEWCLVGAVFVPRMERLIPRIGDFNVDSVVQLQLIPWLDVIEPVLLIFDVGEESMSVVNPNAYFKMIPVTKGRLRQCKTPAGDAVKVMHMVGVADFASYADLEPDESEVFECNMLLFDSAARMVRGNREHRETYMLLAQTKPEFDFAAKSGKDYTSCAHEMLFPGSICLYTKVTELLARRLSPQRVDDDPQTIRFTDVGSGAGAVVLAMAVLSMHLGWEVSGVERDPSLHNANCMWLSNIERACPAMKHSLEELRRRITLHEVGSGESVHPIVRGANVIFCNNYLFNAQVCSHRGILNSVNGVISKAFCECDVGTIVVTTCQLDYDAPNGRALRKVASFVFPKHSFSWPGEITGFVHEVQDNSGTSGLRSSNRASTVQAQL
jgi:hypothetical protein